MTCAVQERTDEPIVDLPTLADSLQLPDGFRVEIINGSIIVSPSPAYRHMRIVKKIERTLDPAMNDELEYFQGGGVEIADTGDRYVPDLMVMPISVTEDEGWEGPPWIRPAEELELAVEVVSPSSALHDWKVKVRGYARAQVPFYLVVDHRKGEIALFSNPENGEYLDVARAVPGTSVKLPEPFNLEIEATPLLT